MGFLRNIFGTNQKLDVGRLGDQYDAAYAPATQAYEQIQGLGQEMINPDSAFNQGRRAMMEAQGADRAAEMARMSQRMVAAGGGAPAGVLAAQGSAGVNKAMADSQAAYNQYLQGAMGKGVGMLSSSANNLTSMAENKMNAMNRQQLANARLDSQASGATAGLIGSGLGMVGNALGGPAGGFLAKTLTGLFGQEGGDVPGGLKQIPEGNKGLAKLPEAVRNKMGYMQYGGMVADDEEGYMYGGKVKYKEGGEVFKPHMMYKGDKEEMANTFADHLRLKKAGYVHKKGMMYGGKVKYQEGGMLSRILLGRRMAEEPMIDQEELAAMKPYADRYNDMRGNYHVQDSRPDLMPMPIAQDYEPHRGRGDDESYIPAQDTRLLKDGSFYNKAQEERELMKAEMLKGMTARPPQSKQSGGMISQVMGPRGPMKIPTRMGGFKVGY